MEGTYDKIAEIITAMDALECGQMRMDIPITCSFICKNMGINFPLVLIYLEDFLVIWSLCGLFKINDVTIKKEDIS